MCIQKVLLSFEIYCLMESCNPSFQFLIALLSLEIQISMELP